MASAKKLPSGSWRVRLSVGKDPASGKQIIKSFTAPTKKEAEFLAAQYNLERRENLPCKLTLEAAGNQYINLRSHVLSPWSIATYRRILRRDLQPLLRYSLDDLTPEIIQAHINAFSANHSPKSARSVHGFLSAVLSQFRPDLRLHTRLPAPRKASITIPTDAQIQKALSLADGQMRLILMIASALGLRRAEICALQWNDLADGTLSVRRSLAKNEDRQWVEKPPKSFSGSRSLPVPAYLLDALNAIRPENAGAQRIFPLTPDALTRRWERLCTACGFSFRFHDIRHYNASVMLALGIPDKYAMQRMGHATPNMLKTVYQHIISEKEKSAADQVNAYMSALQNHPTPR